MWNLAIFCTFVASANTMRIIDLTYDMEFDSITWPINPKFNFSIMTRGLWGHTDIWLENNRVDFAEHTGTHVDAPAHFWKGKWRANHVPMSRLAGPGVIIDVTSKVENDHDYRVTAGDLQDWEKRNGKIPSGAVVLMRSGWGSRYSDKYKVFNTQEPENTSTFHFPSWHEDAAQWLVNNRVINVLGGDVPSTDYGQTTTFPTHLVLAKENICGAESVANLEKLPEKGSMIFVSMIKFLDGSGGPARIFATLDDDTNEFNSAQTPIVSCTMQLVFILLCLSSPVL